MLRTSFVLCAVLLLCLACSDDKGPDAPANPLVGEWRLQYFRNGETTISADSLDEALISLKFYSDKRGVVYISSFGQIEESTDISWDTTADQLIMRSADGETLSLKYQIQSDTMILAEPLSPEAEYFYMRV